MSELETVGDLIEELEQYDRDMSVYVEDQGGTLFRPWPTREGNRVVL